MRVLRHRHTLGLMVLLALAMQAILAVAQTHTHSYTAAGAEKISNRAITYGICRAGTERPCPPTAPHDDHANCPLCWSMSLASTAVLQAPPAIALVRPRVEAPPPVRITACVHVVSSVHFQARAPPRA
jgi:hypothetical protein